MRRRAGRQEWPPALRRDYLAHIFGVLTVPTSTRGEIGASTCDQAGTPDHPLSRWVRRAEWARVHCTTSGNAAPRCGRSCPDTGAAGHGHGQARGSSLGFRPGQVGRTRCPDLVLRVIGQAPPPTIRGRHTRTSPLRLRRSGLEHYVADGGTFHRSPASTSRPPAT